MASYDRPDFLTRHVLNPALALAMKAGISLRGSRVLAVRGRKTGVLRSTPVNPLSYDGGRYLVAPRGTTEWVRNLRAAGEGELRLGRSRERFNAVELPDQEKPQLLRAYLKLWAWETGKWFDGVTAQSADEDLARIAPAHPVFRITGR